MRKGIRLDIKVLVIAVLLCLIPVICLSSCDQNSIDDMLNEYNEAFDPEFGKGSETTTSKLSELIPQDSYEVEYEDELRIEARRGYFNYLWTLSDSSGKLYNCDTGLYVVYVNASLLGLEKGSYTLSVSAKNASGNKYTDTAIVIIK